MRTKGALFNVYDLVDEELIGEEKTLSEACQIIGASNPSYIQQMLTKTGRDEYVYKKTYKVKLVQQAIATREITKADKDVMVDFYLRGAPLQVMADGFHIGVAKVRKILSERGVHLRDMKESHLLATQSKHNEMKKIIDEFNALKVHEERITDLGKVKALRNAGWSRKKIAGEFSAEVEEVDKCLKKLKMK